MNQIEIISLIVVTIVVVFYAIAFFLAFKKSSHFQGKTIRRESMDEDIAEFLVSADCDFFGLEGSCCCTRKKGKDKYKFLTLEEYRANKKRHEKRVNVVANIFTALFYIIIAALFAFGIYLKANKEQLFFGNNAYLVIETGSMAKRNTDNDYLFDEKLKNQYTLDNQIQVFDLIQLKKVKKPEDIKLYDIVAYTDEEGAIVVHRVIEVNVDEKTGITHYRFRGDANSSSSDYEYRGHDESGKGLTLDDVVGKYTGWHSFGLGIFIDYLRSDIGIICLSSGIIVVAFYYFFEDRNTRMMTKREEKVARKMDECKDVRYKWYNVKYRSDKKYKTLTKDIYIDDKDGKNI